MKPIPKYKPGDEVCVNIEKSKNVYTCVITTVRSAEIKTRSAVCIDNREWTPPEISVEYCLEGFADPFDENKVFKTQMEAFNALMK